MLFHYMQYTTKWQGALSDGQENSDLDNAGRRIARIDRFADRRTAFFFRHYKNSSYKIRKPGILKFHLYG